MRLVLPGRGFGIVTLVSFVAVARGASAAGSGGERCRSRLLPERLI